MISKKVPALRFKGFTDEWKKEKAKQIFDNISEKKHAEMPVLAVTQNEGLIYRDDMEKSIIFNANKLKNYKLVKRGNVVISLRSFEGGFEVSDKVGIVSPAYTILNFKNKDNDKFYWKTFLKSYNFIQSLKKVTYGIRDGRSISYRDFSTLKINYTNNISEQKHIGNFFSKLDQLIDLYSQKLEQLKKLKRGYLQKIFPQKGETVPRLRFSGFRGEWKQEKSRNIFKNISIKNNVNMPVLAATQDEGLIYRDSMDKHISYNRNSLKNYKLVKNGNIVISLRSFQGGFETSDKTGIVSPAYTILDLKNKDSSKYYWKTFLKSYKFIQSLKKVTYGIRDGRSISYKDFSTLKINYASDVREQQKIGKFFTKLDHLIDSNLQKLEQLKKQKKAYLQKMFI